MQQKSIIDELKKHISLKKKFKLKNDNSMEIIYAVAKKLFHVNIDKNSLYENFNYKFINVKGKRVSVTFKVSELSEKLKLLIVSREAQEGKYSSEFRIEKNKFLYFEVVNLNESPFQIWSQVGRIRFKRQFNKRKKIVREALKNYE